MKLKKLRTIVATIILLFTHTAQTEVQLQFKDNSNEIKAFSLSQLQDMVSPSNIKVLDPHEQNSQQYSGFATNTLFDHVYGDSWQQQEEVLFTCADGYQPSIPVKRFLQYESFLTYKKVNSPQFQLLNNLHNREIVELGPFYLVWDNVTQPHTSRPSQWPYQITAIEFVKFAEKFPQMTPPDDSSDEVKRGFLVFRNFCQNCHAINGDGGKKAMDLNYPVSVLEHMDEAKLKQWIDKPIKVLPDTTMPALPPNITNRQQKIKDIIAYLKAMSKHKRKPAQEILTSP